MNYCRNWEWIVLVGMLVITASPGVAQELERVKIVYASRSIPFLSAFVAKEKGFYQKYRLDVELIQVAPRLAIAALATSEVDYSMNIGSSLRAGMRGLPVRAIGVAAMPAWWRFVVASSGVHADKAGSALDRYNQASLAVRESRIAASAPAMTSLSRLKTAS